MRGLWDHTLHGPYTMDEVTKLLEARTAWEEAGRSSEPIRERSRSLRNENARSSAGHVKPGANLGTTLRLNTLL